MWSNTATITFAEALKTATIPGVGPTPFVIATVGGVGPRVVVERIVDLPLNTLFEHADPSYPDVYFLDLAAGEVYSRTTPGRFRTVWQVETRWMLPGTPCRYLRHLDDVIDYCRALGGSAPSQP